MCVSNFIPNGTATVQLQKARQQCKSNAFGKSTAVNGQNVSFGAHLCSRAATRWVFFLSLHVCLGGGCQEKCPRSHLGFKIKQTKTQNRVLFTLRRETGGRPRFALLGSLVLALLASLRLALLDVGLPLFLHLRVQPHGGLRILDLQHGNNNGHLRSGTSFD